VVTANAGLAAGTGTAQLTAFDYAPAGLASGTGTAWVPGRRFPLGTLNITVELLLGSTWTDVTAYTYQRNDIAITGMGRADWLSTIQPSQVTLTLNNRDGRFSPKNTTGAYYPYITRNVQLRISVNALSAALISYSGYRFWGEVSEWPPAWDPSQHDIYCDITASGIWRRLSQQQETLGSPFRRYYALYAGSLQGYWPMEDGTGATQFVPWASPAGTANGTWSVLSGGNGPSLAANSSFNGSDAIPVLNASAFNFTVPSGGTATNNVTRFIMSVPAAGDSASGTTNWNILETDSSGTVAKFEVYLSYTGSLIIELRNSIGTIIANATSVTNVKGKPVLVSAELTPSGGNVNWAVNIITPGATSVTESMTGTLASASIGAITDVKISRANALMDTAAGHLAVSYGSPASLVTAAYALNGYLGEYALDRFIRLCTETGLPYETIGTDTTSAPMGPQTDDHLADLLQMIENTDVGLLYECRDQFGLGYRTLASMANQAAAVTLNYAAATIDAALTLTYDDALIQNDITLTNWDGYVQEAVLTAGALSILAPPNGVGNGYGYSGTVNTASDSQVAGIATWLLNLGTVDEIRYPAVSVKLIRSTLSSLFGAIPALRIGDYFQITNPPAFLTTTTIKQLVWGYSETLNAKAWTFTWNAVPESPYETGFSPGTTQLRQLPSTNTGPLQPAGTAGIGSVIANGSITPAMLNSGITIHTLGGNAVTISASAPATPNVNDIWIASATGLISQWNGSAWEPVTFNAADVIQAGTITSALILAETIIGSNIAAGTITAALLATGIVVAGIVNGTVIEGSYILGGGGGGTNWEQTANPPSTPGFFLYYDTGSGNPQLTFSATAAAGSDYWGSTYQGGLTLTGLPNTLTNILSVQDTSGDKLAGIDSGGNIVGQTVSASTDVVIAGNSTLVQLSQAAQGILNYGYISLSGNWPSTAVGTSEIALFELDQAVIGGRIYEFEMNPTAVFGTGGTYPTAIHLLLRYTTDGSTPSTSSSLATSVPAVLAEGSQATAHPGMRCQFFPGSTGTYRFLVTGYVSSGTFQFASADPYIRCTVNDLGAVSSGQGSNNMVVLGTGGTGGGTGKQTYTETFYPSETWSYYASEGLRDTNGNLYHGYYGDPSNWEYSYIQWAAGSLGHNLNTVLGYTVNWVTLKVTNLHTWYDNGMTFGIHSSTTLGGGIGTYSVLLASEFISEGNTYNYTIGSGVWSPFAAGGTTYMVLGPDSPDTNNYAWYGYFVGGTSGNCPRIQVNYTHLSDQERPGKPMDMETVLRARAASLEQAMTSGLFARERGEEAVIMRHVRAFWQHELLTLAGLLATADGGTGPLNTTDNKTEEQ
jgi:hypothetical protein